MNSFAVISKSEQAVFSFQAKLFIFLALFLLFSNTFSAELKVTLSEANSSVTIADTDVIAYELLANGEKKWTQQRRTDSNGIALFDLDGLGNSRQYVLKTKVFNDFKAYSPVIISAGNFQFQLGSFQLDVLDHQLNPYKNHSVIVFEKTDGTNKWMASVVTDNQGHLKLNFPGFSEGKHYVFTLRSKIDNSIIISKEFSSNGLHQYQFGNTPIRVKVFNGITKAVINGQTLKVYKVFPSGKRAYLKQVLTDNNGIVRLDLEGLGKGINYVFSTRLYNDKTHWSAVFSQTGYHSFPLGKLEISVITHDNKPVKQWPVAIFERLANGEEKLVTKIFTDNEGFIRSNFDNLGTGNPLFLRAKSMLDGTFKESEEINSNGQKTFVLGNAPLQVKVVDFISGVGLSELPVTAYEILSSGSLHHVAKLLTDAKGIVRFDLKGLGHGRNYLFKVKPFNSGVIKSDVVSNTGFFKFRVGNLHVVLKNSQNDQLLPGHKLTVYEKMPDTIAYRGTAISDSNGAVRFDLPGLGTGKQFTLKANNIFGFNKNYFSSWQTQQGEFVFAVAPDKDASLDKIEPEISILTPTESAKVSHHGFKIRAMISDNKGIKKVQLIIEDPPHANFSNNLFLSAEGVWNVTIPDNILIPEKNLIVQLKAIDTANNSTILPIKYRVIDDKQPPFVTIDSHFDNEQISHKGFILSGLARDNSHLNDLRITIEDPQKGLLLNNKKIQVSKQDHWAAVVKNSTYGEVLEVTLTATDDAGNESIRFLNLQSVKTADQGVQILNRITFGITPQLLSEVKNIGIDSYIEQQLNPDNIDDSEFEAWISGWLPHGGKELITYQLNYAIFSKKQLLEIMTFFWENHFSTDFRKTKQSTFEIWESNQFRQYALGNFRDLLQVSASSPAMLKYLDGISNSKDSPNENYARELLELHTLGVNGGYNENDIMDIARIFTGRRLMNGVIFFNNRQHDDTVKNILGNEFSAVSAEADVAQLLDLLAQHPATANFICTKLVRFFVADEPPWALVNDCQNKFLSSDGDISQVLRTILYSSVFRSQQHFHKKYKTPLRFVTALERNLQLVHSPSDARNNIIQLGMPLYHMALPTGWGDSGSDWNNTNQLLMRINRVDQVMHNPSGIYRTHQNKPVEFFRNLGYETMEGIIGYLFEITLDHDYTPLQWSMAEEVLQGQALSKFDIDDPEIEQRIRELLSLVLCYPSYQLH